MLLLTAAFLLAVGLAAWTLGTVFSYHGIGAIGAVTVLIVGGAIILTGLEVQTGATTTITYDTINNSTVATEKVVSRQYTATSVGEIFGVGVLGETLVGGLLMLLGTALLSQVYAEDL